MFRVHGLWRSLDVGSRLLYMWVLLESNRKQCQALATYTKYLGVENSIHQDKVHSAVVVVPGSLDAYALPEDET